MRLDPGKSECNDAAAERAETGKGACDDIDMIVRVVTPGSARSARNGVGTAQVIYVNGDMLKREKGMYANQDSFCQMLCRAPL